MLSFINHQKQRFSTTSGTNHQKHCVFRRVHLQLIKKSSLFNETIKNTTRFNAFCYKSSTLRVSMISVTHQQKHNVFATNSATNHEKSQRCSTLSALYKSQKWLPDRNRVNDWYEFPAVFSHHNLRINLHHLRPLDSTIENTTCFNDFKLKC